jgi:hypothetical protein
MAKAKKTKSKKPREEKYEEKVIVTGSFLDIMKAASKDATNKSAPKKP